MLASSRAEHSGLRLEVNERILDSCTALTKAIKILILKAKTLQKEIVEQGRVRKTLKSGQAISVSVCSYLLMFQGTASHKEFYKKHHRWTEGLISAAKAVGWGANVLT